MLLPNATLDASPAGATPTKEEVVATLLALAQRRSIERLARSLGVDIHDGTNTAVVRALDRITTYSASKGTLAAWLVGILRNSLFQLRRDGRRGRVCLLGNGSGGAIDVIDRRQRNMIEDLLIQEQAAQVRALLDVASPFVQEVVKLREEGLRFREVAVRMGVPTSLVVTRWFRWCRWVRKTLAAEE